MDENTFNTYHCFSSPICSSLNEVKQSLTNKQLGGTTANHSQWFWFACACLEIRLLWAVVLIYQCGGKKEHCVWSVQRFLFPPIPTLCFPLCISVVGACLHGCAGAHRWVVRFSQPLVQSSSWNWLPIMEALGFLRHPTFTQ